ncbi:TetR/AcrR family transcriptional regulator [Roseateles sp.]|uniref:TetR/AcrR family transcriptional regulator n=1 Tax=Roseateles sp. TaxID=1971397 RepID=UPI002E098730|nr:TetR/AcrR family transcriptional regulator [Roseateles sp.]
MVQKPEDAGPTPARRPRGRPRSFDAAATLAQATLAFWRQGYAATSMDDLGAATGLNRPSLYGAFGDKHALYLQALRLYTEQSNAAMAAALQGRPLREGLLRVYDLALQLYYPPDEAARGCLLIGTAATEAPRDEAIRRQLGDSLRSFTAAFETRLKQAVDAGELPAGTDVATRAELASAVLHSMALRARAGDAREALAALARAGVEMVLSPLGTGAR